MAIDPTLSAFWGSVPSGQNPWNIMGGLGLNPNIPGITDNSPGGLATTDPNAIATALYQDYLGRAPDPGGLQNAINAYNTYYQQAPSYDSGTNRVTAAAGQLANQLFTSPEGQQFMKSMNTQAPSPLDSLPKAMNFVGGGTVPVGNAPGAVNPATTPSPAYAASPAPPSGGGGGGGGGGFDLSSLMPKTQGMGPGGGSGGSGGFDFNAILNKLFSNSTNPTTVAPTQQPTGQQPAGQRAPAQSPVSIGGSGLPAGYLGMIAGVNSGTNALAQR